MPKPTLADKLGATRAVRESGFNINIETTAPQQPVSRELAAALALAHEATLRGSEPIIPEPPPSHILIEAEITGCHLRVTMPAGELWLYTMPLDEPMPFQRTVLASIVTAQPSTAEIFRPSGEGIHPHLGTALRYGVERSVK